MGSSICKTQNFKQVEMDDRAKNIPCSCAQESEKETDHCS